MNRNASYALILALTLLIVLPVVDSVNATVNHDTGSNSMLLASGSPAPPPTPPVLSQSTLVASGSPAPPPTPPLFGQPVLVASGSPAPPPTPPLKSSVFSI
jgi:hypothetical protein